MSMKQVKGKSVKDYILVEFAIRINKYIFVATKHLRTYCILRDYHIYLIYFFLKNPTTFQKKLIIQAHHSSIYLLCITRIKYIINWTLICEH